MAIMNYVNGKWVGDIELFEMETGHSLSAEPADLWEKELREWLKEKHPETYGIKNDTVYSDLSADYMKVSIIKDVNVSVNDVMRAILIGIYYKSMDSISGKYKWKNFNDFLKDRYEMIMNESATDSNLKKLIETKCNADIKRSTYET